MLTCTHNAVSLYIYYTVYRLPHTCSPCQKKWKKDSPWSQTLAWREVQEITIITVPDNLIPALGHTWVHCCAACQWLGPVWRSCRIYCHLASPCGVWGTQATPHVCTYPSVQCSVCGVNQVTLYVLPHWREYVALFCKPKWALYALWIRCALLWYSILVTLALWPPCKPDSCLPTWL